jgi:hypothetical protein
MRTWAEDEVQTADLEDRRLNKRLALLLERLGEHSQLSIPAACGGWKETMGAYRFFDNDKATFKKILAPHRDATVERMKSSPVVLLAQDSTEYDENICLGPKGLGTLKEVTKRTRRLHPTLAFIRRRAFAWVSSRRRIGRVTAPARDKRDGAKVWTKKKAGTGSKAIYQDYAPTVRAEWIIRATQNRHLLAASEEAAQCLWDALQQAPVLGYTEVNVKLRPNRAARLAHITLRAATVTLKPPARFGYRLPALSINAVLAREETPPAGKEPLEWLLLTSLPVVNFEQAATVVEWYAVRWCIEVYFHVLKSGCQIKRLHLETDERLLPCLALYMVIAWRVLFSLMLARATPDMDCEIVFDPQEWRAAYIVVKRCPPPLTPPRLGEVILLVASLGGYFARKHDGPPGAKAMWIGLQRLRDFVIALDAQQDVAMRCV